MFDGLSPIISRLIATVIYKGLELTGIVPILVTPIQDAFGNNIGGILTDLTISTHALHHHSVECSVFAWGSDVFAIFVNGGSKDLAYPLSFTILSWKHDFSAN